MTLVLESALAFIVMLVLGRAHVSKLYGRVSFDGKISLLSCLSILIGANLSWLQITIQIKLFGAFATVRKIGCGDSLANILDHLAFLTLLALASFISLTSEVVSWMLTIHILSCKANLRHCLT